MLAPAVQTRSPSVLATITGMPRPNYVTCAGCSQPFQGAAKDVWCAECLPTVEPVVVEMTADQRRRIESLAVIRGVTVAEVLRQGITSLTGKTRGKLASPKDTKMGLRLARQNRKA
jgi:hypothetical protein